MEKYLIDCEECSQAAGIICREDGRLIDAVPSGVIVINTYDENPVYDALELDFNIRFCRGLRREELPFYTVPVLAVFAKDSYGNVFGTLGGLGDLCDDDYPVAMITADKRAFTVAGSLKDFLSAAVCAPVDFRERYGFSGFVPTADKEDNRKYISDMLGIAEKQPEECCRAVEIFDSKAKAGEKYQFIK